MRAGGSQGSLNSRREQGHRRPSGDWCPLGVCVWSGQEVREPGSGKMMVGTQGLWWGQLKREVRRSGLEGENGLRGRAGAVGKEQALGVCHLGSERQARGSHGHRGYSWSVWLDQGGAEGLGPVPGVLKSEQMPEQSTQIKVRLKLCSINCLLSGSTADAVQSLPHPRNLSLRAFCRETGPRAPWSPCRGLAVPREAPAAQ